MEQSRNAFKIEWCSREAALFACRKWHYSGGLPTGKTVRIGLWEDDEFIGCVVFGRGANKSIGSPYGLKQTECIELCRVALREHKTPVSQLMANAIRFLKRKSPGIRLVVSYADPAQNHHGGVYQAGNWVYTGAGSPDRQFVVHGKARHPKSIHSMGVKQSIEAVRKHLDPNATLLFTPGKHRYLYPMDKPMRKQIQTMAKPYPMRMKQAMAGTTSTAAVQLRPMRSISGVSDG